MSFSSRSLFTSLLSTLYGGEQSWNIRGDLATIADRSERKNSLPFACRSLLLKQQI